jgi:hypothetical protein
LAGRLLEVVRNLEQVAASFGQLKSLQGVGITAEGTGVAEPRNSAEVGQRNSREEAASTEAYVEASTMAFTFADDPSNDREPDPVHSKTIGFKA